MLDHANAIDQIRLQKSISTNAIISPPNYNYSNIKASFACIATSSTHYFNINNSLADSTSNLTLITKSYKT
jgi:hypothetical protein